MPKVSVPPKQQPKKPSWCDRQEPLPSFRKRHPPIDRHSLYGEHAGEMIPGTDFFQKLVHRAAYVHTTGCFPSHLRAKNTSILQMVTEPFPRPTSIDGRHGQIRLRGDAIRDLKVNVHPMVEIVREKVAQRFKIQVSRGPNTRRGYSKIFMYQIDSETQSVKNPITVTIEGAIKEGWY